MERIERLLSYLEYFFQGTYTKKIFLVFVDLFVQLLPFLIAGIILSTLLFFISQNKEFSTSVGKAVFPLSWLP